MPGLMETSSSVFFFRIKAGEVIEATKVIEAVEVIEAAEIPNAR